jgi:hypothetical protein
MVNEQQSRAETRLFCEGTRLAYVDGAMTDFELICSLGGGGLALNDLRASYLPTMPKSLLAFHLIVRP